MVGIACLTLSVDARPKNGNGANSKAAKGNGNTNAAAAAAAAGGISTATDGSTILDKTVMIKYISPFATPNSLLTCDSSGLPIRYKISAPASQFTTASGVPGGTATATSNGTQGLNVLLHGDGGQSFFDFPNQAVQAGLMGIVVLAPNTEMFWGGGSGLQRTDGVAHAAAVDALIQTQLPQDVMFDMSQVFFTGVSGGSLLLSGFYVPAFMSKYQTGVLLNCGALQPQVAFVDGANMIANTKIHFQSTQSELALLQPEIPKVIKVYEQAATAAGLSAAQIGALQTVNNAPVGGHW